MANLQADAVADRFLDDLKKAAADRGLPHPQTGAIAWPPDRQGELATMREQFESRQLASAYGIDPPAFAAAFVQAHEAGTISERRKELLFRILCAKIMLTRP
jgi:hypothetical protein